MVLDNGVGRAFQKLYEVSFAPWIRRNDGLVSVLNGLLHLRPCRFSSFLDRGLHMARPEQNRFGMQHDQLSDQVACRQNTHLLLYISDCKSNVSPQQGQVKQDESIASTDGTDNGSVQSQPRVMIAYSFLEDQCRPR